MLIISKTAGRMVTMIDQLDLPEFVDGRWEIGMVFKLDSTQPNLTVQAEPV